MRPPRCGCPRRRCRGWCPGRRVSWPGGRARRRRRFGWPRPCGSCCRSSMAMTNRPWPDLVGVDEVFGGACFDFEAVGHQWRAWRSGKSCSMGMKSSPPASAAASLAMACGLFQTSARVHQRSSTMDSPLAGCLVPQALVAVGGVARVALFVSSDSESRPARTAPQPPFACVLSMSFDSAKASPGRPKGVARTRRHRTHVAGECCRLHQHSLSNTAGSVCDLRCGVAVSG